MGLFKSKQHYKIRTGARSTSKVQERELINKAKIIGKNPDLIIPKCEGNCARCPIKKIRKRIHAISKYRDDPKKLKALSKRGDKISRAYAGTLSLPHSETPPFMGLFKTPFGQIPYAMIGQTDQRKLIGIQHYDHKEYRLMTYLELCEKKKIFIYSVKDGMVCTGTTPAPSAEFVKDAVKDLDVTLKRNEKIPRTFVTKYLVASKVTKGMQTRIPYLKINWKSADAIVAMDEITLREKTTHSVGKLAALMAGPNIKSDFSVEVVFNPECREGTKRCVFREVNETDSSLYKEYMDYKLNDQMLVKKQYDNIMEGYSSSDRDLFMYDSYCFSENLDAFFRFSKPTELEELALRAVLKRVKTPKLYRKKPSLPIILSDYWKDYGFWGLKAACDDKKIAKKLHSDGNADAGEIGDLLKEARESSKAIAIIRQLPEYNLKTLPIQARLADNIAKTHKAKGKESAIKLIDEQNPENSQALSTMFAFLLCLKATAGREWKFSDAQRDVGKFLLPLAEELLIAGPGEYNDALKKLLQYTGSTVEIVPI